MPEDMPDNSGVIALPPFIYGAAFLIGLVIHFVFPISFLPQQPALWLGVLLTLVAGLIVASALRTLSR